MKNLFDGLFLYEITLLFLGALLFVILCIGLLIYFLKKEPINHLLFFFIIPVIMIGFPGINQISISNDKIELTKNQQKLIDNPNDSVAREKVEQITEKLENRASSPNALVQISTSNLLLGNSEKAIVLADKALASDRENMAAREIKNLASVQMQAQKADTVGVDSLPADRTRVINSDFQRLRPHLMRVTE
jgi:hypothetical protein